MKRISSELMHRLLRASPWLLVASLILLIFLRVMACLESSSDGRCCRCCCQNL